jgi:hypothetical protein
MAAPAHGTGAWWRQEASTAVEDCDADTLCDLLTQRDYKRHATPTVRP